MTSPVAALLGSTARWAAQHTAYYREWADVAAGVATTEDFAEVFPILEKQVVAARANDFVDWEEFPSRLTLTSGTTFRPDSPPLLVFSSETQQRYRAEYLKTIAVEDPDAAPGLHIHVSNGTHGAAPPASPGHFVVPLRSEAHFFSLVTLLRHGFPTPAGERRVISLSASVNMMKLFTLFLMEQGLKATEFAVRHLAVTSWHLPPHWEAVLKDFWGCPVMECYGLSEIPNFVCGRWSGLDEFRFEGPVYTEIVALDSAKSVTAGVGRLIATPLLPFACSQPLLRYDTGDIVEVAAWDRETLPRSFRLLGRRAQSIIHDFGRGRELVLAAIEADTILSPCADLNSTVFDTVYIARLRTKCGRPIYDINLREHTPGRPLLEVGLELRYSPIEFAARARELAAEVSRQFCALPRLQRLRDAGDIEIAVTTRAPGALSGPRLC